MHQRPGGYPELRDAAYSSAGDPSSSQRRPAAPRRREPARRLSSRRATQAAPPHLDARPRLDALVARLSEARPGHPRNRRARARGAAALAVASGEPATRRDEPRAGAPLDPAPSPARCEPLLAFFGPLHDSGLATAFVARGEHPRAYAATLAWGATASGIIAAVLVASAAPLVAAAFDTPAALDVTRVLAVTFAFRGLAAAPLAVLTRELAFGRRAVTLIAGATPKPGRDRLLRARSGPWALVIGRSTARREPRSCVDVGRGGRGVRRRRGLGSLALRGRVLGKSLAPRLYLDNIVVVGLGTAARAYTAPSFAGDVIPAIALSTVVAVRSRHSA